MMRQPRPLATILSLLALAAFLASACAPPVPHLVNRSARATSPSPSGSRSTPLPSLAPPSGSSQGSAFDATHAAAVLAPAVGLVIVNLAGGHVAEGSGFVIDVNGGQSYLATNNHVIDKAQKVQVLMPDGRHFTAALQGTDPLEDVAVLKVPDTLPKSEFADSTQLKPGQPVVAIGSALGGQGFGSVTVGVISALHRTLTNVGTSGQASESLPDVLQTDAPINPGNSGGPLADGAGRVVGMNTAGDTNANSVGFAIPSRVVQRIAGNLIAGRTPGHPYAGVSYLPVEEALVTQDVQGYGVVVSCVVPGSPAEQGGVRAHDVIENLDGRPLNNGITFAGVLQLHNPGDTVAMSLVRAGQKVDLQITLGERPTTPASCSG